MGAVKRALLIAGLLLVIVVAAVFVLRPTSEDESHPSPATTGGTPNTTEGTPNTTTGTPSTTSADSSPTTGPSSTSTVPPDDDLRACESQARAAANAALVYQPSQNMTVGESSEVVVALGLTKGAATASALPGTASTAVLSTGPLRCEVEAELTGGSAFTVLPAGPRLQSFVDSDVLRWAWEVTPLRPGSQLVLRLRLQPKVESPTGEVRSGTDRVIDARISVQAEEGPSAVEQVRSGTLGVLKWLVVVVLGGAVITVVGAYARKYFGPKGED